MEVQKILKFDHTQNIVNKRALNFICKLLLLNNEYGKQIQVFIYKLQLSNDSNDFKLVFDVIFKNYIFEYEISLRNDVFRLYRDIEKI